MSARPTSKRRKAKRRRPAQVPTQCCGRRAELEQLRQQVGADKLTLDRLLTIGVSPTAEVLIEQARRRYEQALQRSCELQHELLAETEERIEKLQKQNRALQQTNEQLTYQVKRLRLQLREALGVAAATRDQDDEQHAADSTSAVEQNTQRSRTGKRGAPKGHRGRTRDVPPTFDREQVIAPADLCSCGCSDVIPLLDYDLRYVEDIPPVSKEVTRRIYLHGRCQNCGKVLRHPEATSRPLVVTGPNLAAHLTMMNQMGVTFRKLSTFSTKAFGIELSAPGALGIVNRVVASLEGSYAEVLQALPDQDWLNGDETGWKVMGRNGYIWCFCNHDLAVFHHDYRRSSKVIEEILGDAFGGIVVCDFYAAYNCIGTTQRCLVHLLRDIKTEREILRGSKLLERFEKAVRRFIENGLQVQAMPDGEAKDRAVAKLEKQLDRLTRMKVTKGKATTLVKRIGKYRDDLIRFVTHPGVEFHNNRAERQLRPIVVSRKVSFGSNTEHGARRYCIIHTIVETCKLQGIDPIEFIHRAYVSGGLDVPSLTGADPPAAA